MVIVRENYKKNHISPQKLKFCLPEYHCYDSGVKGSWDLGGLYRVAPDKRALVTGMTGHDTTCLRGRRTLRNCDLSTPQALDHGEFHHSMFDWWWSGWWPQCVDVEESLLVKTVTKLVLSLAHSVISICQYPDFKSKVVNSLQGCTHGVWPTYSLVKNARVGQLLVDQYVSQMTNFSLKFN